MAALLPVKGFLKERFWIWIAGVAFTALGSLTLALLTPVGARIAFLWNLPSQMAVIETRLSRALGEDRVIRQRQGLSYVEEPVHVGQPVNLILVLERTMLGASCRLVDWVPLFTDASNIPTPGTRAGPVAGAGPSLSRRDRPIEAEATKLRIEIMAPPALIPGRVEVYLSMDYDCAGQHVPERSEPVIYRLLPAP